jgi:hypothetical protein
VCWRAGFEVKTVKRLGSAKLIVFAPKNRLAIKMPVLQWVPFWVPFGLDKSLICIILDSMFGITKSMGVIKTPPDRLVNKHEKNKLKTI